MGEIKFKAHWNDSNFVGWSLPFSLMDIKGRQVLVCEHDGSDYQPLSHAKVIAQYIGIKDKDGKEIYVGDILLTPGKHKLVIEILNMIEGDPKFRNIDITKCEVIGNIYDNMEYIAMVK